MNCGLEHTFYVPLEYYSEFYAAIKAAGLDVFQTRTLGIPLGRAKDYGHWQVEAELACRKFELKPRVNLFEEHYKKEQ